METLFAKGQTLSPSSTVSVSIAKPFRIKANYLNPVVIFILVAMALDRYCTVCPNVFTTFVGKYRSSPVYLTTVSLV